MQLAVNAMGAMNLLRLRPDFNTTHTMANILQPSPLKEQHSLVAFELWTLLRTCAVYDMLNLIRAP